MDTQRSTQLSNPRETAWRLSMGVAILMAVQAGVGLGIPSLYRDEEWVRATWFGNDLVTLFVAVPLLTWSLRGVLRGSRRAELVWYSMLGYGLYNYAYYVFGAVINWFFPLYVVLFALPVFALILALGRLDAEAIASDFAASTPRRWIGGYMLLTGVGLALAWLGQWAAFMLSGSAPSIGPDAFRLIAAMDLSFMVPWFVLGATLLVRSRPWGYVIAPIIVMKGATYTLVLTAASIVGAARDVEGASAQIPIWAAWTLLGVLALWGLLGNLRAAVRP